MDKFNVYKKIWQNIATSVSLQKNCLNDKNYPFDTYKQKYTPETKIDQLCDLMKALSLNDMPLKIRVNENVKRFKNKKDVIICYRCKKPGHIRANCFSLYAKTFNINESIKKKFTFDPKLRRKVYKQK